MNINLELATVPANTRVNIARGMAAFNRVVRTHGICPLAMYRSELGWIGFNWGNEGDKPPAFQRAAQVTEWLAAGNTPYDHGGGWSHILAKRAWEGRWIAQYQWQNAEAIARFLIIVLAKGPVPTSGRKRKIEYSGYWVIVEQRVAAGASFWMLSGYEPVKDHYRVITESADGMALSLPHYSAAYGITPGQTMPTCPPRAGTCMSAVAADPVWSLAYALYPDKDFQAALFWHSSGRRRYLFIK